ncbi:MAG: hypothetical protein ACI9LM_003761 [Alteromonadaceae bacterium]|jgi:hypothetical protein
MKNIISELNNHHSTNSDKKPSSKLSSLWLKIEKHQKRNANFNKKTLVIFNKFKQEALPFEEKQAELIAAQVEHLIPSISKKSLSSPQRDELLDWITSDIDYLDSHPFSEKIDASSLRNKVNKELGKLAKNQEKPITDDTIIELQNMLNDMFNGELQLERDELIDIIKNPEQLEKYIKDFCENIKDQEEQFDDDIGSPEEAFEDERYYQEYDNFEQHTGEKTLNTFEKLFKGSQLNKIYKRLASKLHPDKESDADKKLIKHDLMQQLATARKNKDVFTLLTLYHEHIDDDSFHFDTETIAAIESLLEKKVSELNYELRELKSSDTPEVIVWRHFSGRTNKITSHNIENHINQLKDEFDTVNQSIADTKTVKTLKFALNTRIRERESSFFNFGGSFEDLLNMDF